MSSESMTLMVNGTSECELRTTSCAMRFTYSVTAGSLTSLDDDSTCSEYCLPMATWRSSPYQLPNPREQPTFRLLIASMSRMLWSRYTCSGGSGDVSRTCFATGAAVFWASNNEEGRSSAKTASRNAGRSMFTPEQSFGEELSCRHITGHERPRQDENCSGRFKAGRPLA